MFEQNKNLLLGAVAVIVIWLGVYYFAVQGNWDHAHDSIDAAKKDLADWEEKSFKTGKDKEGKELLPSPEARQAILDSDGHDTVLTEIPDIARASVWPGAMARSRRNAFIERWAGREWKLRAQQPEAAAALQKAMETGDADNAALLIGQDAGLIHDIPPAGEIVERIVAEAEILLKDRLPRLCR